MFRGLYTAYTGMLAEQQKMDTISNNMANVNTAGYKKDNVMFESFRDVYVRKIHDPEKIGTQRIGRATLGVKVGEVYTNFEQGPLQQTDDPLNIALDGLGFFAVGSMNANGDLVERYTRDGSFGLNPMGQVMSKDGQFLLGQNGPITLENANARITETGDVYDGNVLVDRIKMIDFENRNTLKKIGNSLYEKPEGAQERAFEGVVIQGFVEGSNANAVDEMVNLINVMRSYETNQKVITTYDETMNKSANEIGRL